MTELSAEDAARYALSCDVLLLVGALAIGTPLTMRGVTALSTANGPLVAAVLQAGIGVAAVIAGVALQVSGTVGLLYKLVHDATQ